MLTKKAPLYVSGGAAYPHSKALVNLTTVETRYGEEYSLARWNVPDHTLWLPRGACPASEDDRRTDGLPVAYEYRFTPRNDEQSRIVHAAVKLLLEGENFIVQAPTGWGKTVVGCAIAAKLQRKTLVITTKEDILQQWIDAAKMVMGLKDSQISTWRGDEEPDPAAVFVVALVQSVMKGPERYPLVEYGSFGLVICDEVHRMGADQFSQSMWWFPGRLRLGLSATPYRKDGREYVFLAHIGPVLLKATQETLIPKIVVKQSDWKLPRTVRYQNGVRAVVKMDHEAGKLGHVTKMLGKYLPRNLMIVRFALAAYRKKRSLIIFSDSLSHLNTLHWMLRDQGVDEDDIGYYVGITGKLYPGTKKERKAARERAKVKPVILATYQMASEATDIPWLDACVLAIPRSDVVQIVGRIRREYPGKKVPVVLDIVDGDSPVFSAFAKSRMAWYRSLGCEVIFKD